jgi:indole-3-glycerol phosphate synthase
MPVTVILEYPHCERSKKPSKAVLPGTSIRCHHGAMCFRVLNSGATLNGVSNRDLHRFVTDLDVTLRLVDHIPPHVTFVSESDIRTPADVDKLEAAGVSAILVGETLMRADDIGEAVEQLLGLLSESSAGHP